MFGDDSVKYKLENVYVTVDRKVANIDLTALKVNLLFTLFCQFKLSLQCLCLFFKGCWVIFQFLITQSHIQILWTSNYVFFLSYFNSSKPPKSILSFFFPLLSLHLILSVSLSSISLRCRVRRTNRLSRSSRPPSQSSTTHSSRQTGPWTEICSCRPGRDEVKM